MDIEGIKSKKLAGKKIALCVTGSVAAIQAPRIARELIRYGSEVFAYMTGDARGIIHPNAIEFATGRGVVTKLTGKLEHLAEFDLILIAPATANTISKIACGIADSAVSALCLSSKARVLIAPAMHGAMNNNPILLENVEKLKRHGYKFIEPKYEEGKAKLAKIDTIVDSVIFELCKKDFSGLNVLVTSGPTIEYIDPIRVITNKSSGKMGIEIAREAYFRGANVKLIYGFGTEATPSYLKVINVERTSEMLKEVEKAIPKCDIFISAAAVSDFTIDSEEKKIESKRKLELTLIPTPKILEKVKKYDTFKVGFKALHKVSKEELIDAAYKILDEYNLDLVIANDVSKGVFRSNKNEVFIIDRDKHVTHVPLTTKAEVSEKVLDRVRKVMK